MAGMAASPLAAATRALQHSLATTEGGGGGLLARLDAGVDGVALAVARLLHASGTTGNGEVEGLADAVAAVGAVVRHCRRDGSDTSTSASGTSAADRGGDAALRRWEAALLERACEVVVACTSLLPRLPLPPAVYTATVGAACAAFDAGPLTAATAPALARVAACILPGAPPADVVLPPADAADAYGDAGAPTPLALLLQPPPSLPHVVAARKAVLSALAAGIDRSLAPPPTLPPPAVTPPTLPALPPPLLPGCTCSDANRRQRAGQCAALLDAVLTVEAATPWYFPAMNECWKCAVRIGGELGEVARACPACTAPLATAVSRLTARLRAVLGGALPRGPPWSLDAAVDDDAPAVDAAAAVGAAAAARVDGKAVDTLVRTARYQLQQLGKLVRVASAVLATPHPHAACADVVAVVARVAALAGTTPTCFGACSIGPGGGVSLPPLADALQRHLAPAVDGVLAALCAEGVEGAAAVLLSAAPPAAHLRRTAPTGCLLVAVRLLEIAAAAAASAQALAAARCLLPQLPVLLAAAWPPLTARWLAASALAAAAVAARSGPGAGAPPPPPPPPVQSPLGAAPGARVAAALAAVCVSALAAGGSASLRVVLAGLAHAAFAPATPPVVHRIACAAWAVVGSAAAASGQQHATFLAASCQLCAQVALCPTSPAASPIRAAAAVLAALLPTAPPAVVDAFAAQWLWVPRRPAGTGASTGASAGAGAGHALPLPPARVLRLTAALVEALDASGAGATVARLLPLPVVNRYAGAAAAVWEGLAAPGGEEVASRYGATVGAVVVVGSACARHADAATRDALAAAVTHLLRLPPTCLPPPFLLAAAAASVLTLQHVAGVAELRAAALAALCTALARGAPRELLAGPLTGLLTQVAADLPAAAVLLVPTSPPSPGVLPALRTALASLMPPSASSWLLPQLVVTMMLRLLRCSAVPHSDRRAIIPDTATPLVQAALRRRAPAAGFPAPLASRLLPLSPPAGPPTVALDWDASLAATCTVVELAEAGVDAGTGGADSVTSSVTSVDAAALAALLS